LEAGYRFGLLLTGITISGTFDVVYDGIDETGGSGTGFLSSGTDWMQWASVLDLQIPDDAGWS
jgi:hypothetical protein